MDRLLTRSRHLVVALALALIAATGLQAATFTASNPGERLLPIGGAEELIKLVQGSQNLLWTSLAGDVAYHTTIGWPSTDGKSELGGALVMETADSDIGLIRLTEAPMQTVFEFK